MTTNITDNQINQLLMKVHQTRCEIENEKDQAFLKSYEHVSDNLWHSFDDPNAFIVRTLLDWDEDEGDTYESAKHLLGEEIKFWHEDLFDISDEWEVEELRAGYLWSLFRVTFK